MDTAYGRRWIRRIGNCEYAFSCEDLALIRRISVWRIGQNVKCKKQTIVANSTTEAEYVAAANYCGQVLWIQNQMLDYGFNFMNTKIHIDNESTIFIVKNPVFHSKTKHIKIRHHFIRDSYEKKLIQVIKIHTDHNVADLLTKKAKRTTEISQSSRPIHLVVDETVYKEWEDRMERAATTASSLVAEQDSGNINRTQSMATLNESFPQGTGSGSGPRCQDTILGGAKAQIRFEAASKQSNDPPLSRVNTLGSGEDSMKLMELMEHKKEMIFWESNTLFATMMVQANQEEGVDSDIPTDSQQTPITTQPSTSKPQKKQSRRKQRKDIEVSQSSASTEPMTEKETNEESVPKHSYDPSQSEFLPWRLKTTQALEIALVGSTRRVESSNDEGLGTQEDASKRGMSIEDIDKDAEVSLVDETQGRMRKDIEQEEFEDDDEALLEDEKNMEIVQDKEEIAIDAIPLATKPPMIIEYKIVKEGHKGFYHLIRVDGSSKWKIEDSEDEHQCLGRMLGNLRLLRRFLELILLSYTLLLLVDTNENYAKMFSTSSIQDTKPYIKLRSLRSVHWDQQGLPKLKFKKDHLCSACSLGKSKKSCHKPKADSSNQEKLYLLHMDLCGPMCVESINDKKYILVIVDDYSRFMWVKFLRSKDEAPEVIIKCLKQIQVRMNATVRNTRTDNGTEFVEAVSIACYTQNCSLIRLRYNKTPYELMHEKKPDLSFPHAFGSLCYPTNDSEDLGKLKPKADIGNFVGYAPAKKVLGLKRLHGFLEVTTA
ncbi:retrovirus-related pol polyprotein from transposon TNT 1-94 [Tanacetum coccineum]|uniref:Retrovirus-related pol polyprotein from transposon TNT 1-94 n=1 Tax=Tanacetum coccineum TaxID=301880 RepID=A0ABQ5EXG6_9ASTR